MKKSNIIITFIAIISIINLINPPKIFAECCNTDVECNVGIAEGSCVGHSQECIPGKVCIYTIPPEDPPSFSENTSEYNATIGIKTELTTINGIITVILPIILSFSGVILLIMLISGGFTMLTAVSDPKAAEAGKQRITTAVMGFFILFASYWIIQILEIILGINILGS